MGAFFSSESKAACWNDDYERVTRIAFSLRLFEQCNGSTSTSPDGFMVPIMPLHASLLVERCTGVPLSEPLHTGEYKSITFSLRNGEVHQEKRFAQLHACLQLATAQLPNRRLVRSTESNEQTCTSHKVGMRNPDSFLGSSSDARLVLLPIEVTLKGELERGEVERQMGRRAMYNTSFTLLHRHQAGAYLCREHLNNAT
jgi:hypothetical protein